MQNGLRKKLAAGRTVYGTWNIISNATICEILAQSGIDFQILDMEHGTFGFESLENSIRAIDQYDCSPLVRIAGLNLNDSQKALDLGAHGLIFPQIKNTTDAELAISYCTFPPVGVRGLNPFTRFKGYSVNTESKLNQTEKIFGLNSIIIESKEALVEIDSILKIENLDMVYLGAYDMSVSLGVPGDVNSSIVKNFLESGIQKIRQAGKVAGVMATNKDSSQHLEKCGANLIVLGVDSHLIGSVAAQTLTAYKNK
jgi:4-hydroxy-2-oxoheptanedioate aldolase